MNLIKEDTPNTRPYMIRRGKKAYWVYPAEDHKVRPVIQGGATANTPASAASNAAAVLKNYLQIAPEKYTTILGTIASGSAGGANANVIWQQQIPIVPAFCTAIEYIIEMPVTLTLATGASATLSPFAPYSAVAMQLTLGGAPPWPLTELTPWHIDDTTHRVNYDPFYQGLGGGGVSPFGQATNAASTPWAGNSNVLDLGPLPDQIGGSGSLYPNQTVTNSGTATATYNYTLTFSVRINLQRKRHLLWGAVPFGDPENRPYNITQLLPLIGSNPEQSLFINSTSTNNSCVTNGVTNVYCTYELSYIDLLPPNVTSAPAPTVGYGIQLTTSSPSNLSAGALYPITHRTAQLYTAIHHILVNNQLPLRADYFGLWDDQDQQSARWAFDAQVNTFNEFYRRYHRRYRRYPYYGTYTVEMDDGVFPEIPSVTPLVALMSPDASYANAFNVPVTPAMTTTLRIPSGTTLGTGNSAPYVRNYEFGLVRVPY